MLVIRGGAIGDFILTLPALAALRAAFPDTHLEVLAYPKVAALALEAGYVDAVRALESRELAGFFARKGELDVGWSAYFGGFNLIVSYLYDPDLFFQSNIARVSKAQWIAGPHRPDESRGEHATQQLLRPLEQLAIFDADLSPRVRVTPDRLGSQAGVPGEDRPLLVVHPGSGSDRKNWPEDRWRVLLKRWAGEGAWRIALVGGEAEGDRLERLASGLSGVGILRNVPLGELASRMAQARLFVGHDSGVSHLAAATGIPGLVLWGPTDEVTWRPRSDRFMSLRHSDGLEGLAVDVVDARVREMMQASVA